LQFALFRAHQQLSVHVNTAAHWRNLAFCQLQYQALDLIGCLMAPLFHATLLKLSWGLISTIYGLVLILKGYQIGLLFLPAAQQQHAHQHARCGSQLQVSLHLHLQGTAPGAVYLSHGSVISSSSSSNGITVSITIMVIMMITTSLIVDNQSAIKLLTVAVARCHCTHYPFTSCTALHCQQHQEDRSCDLRFERGRDN
jgi:hypothetical protein